MPQPSDEVIFIALILGIAIFILIVLLIGVVFIYYYEHRSNDKLTLSSVIVTIKNFFPKADPKKESTPSLLAATITTPALEPGQDLALKSVEMDKTERLPKRIQMINWWVSLIIAAYVVWLNYYHLGPVGITSPYAIFVLFAFMSPISLAVAWLRLTGVVWRQALLLFIWVLVAYFGIWIILPYLGFFLKYVSGSCC